MKQKLKTLNKCEFHERLENAHQGFMFCPRCSHIVIGENIAGVCDECGYRFSQGYRE
jgi:hypothetical protein